MWGRPLGDREGQEDGLRHCQRAEQGRDDDWTVERIKDDKDVFLQIIAVRLGYSSVLLCKAGEHSFRSSNP